MKTEEVQETIFEVLDELNEMLPSEHRLQKSLATELIGKESPLDSVGLVNLIVLTETKIEEHFGYPLTLVETISLSPEDSPLHTVGRLIDHICELLEECQNA